MNKKTFIILCSVVGLVGGIAVGIIATEPDRKEQSPETKAALNAAMERSENSDAFVDLIEPDQYAAMKASSSEVDAINFNASKKDLLFSELADYSELCPAHYGAVTVMVSKDPDGVEVLRLIGPKEEVDYIRTKTEAYTDVHYCAPLEY